MTRTFYSAFFFYRERIAASLFLFFFMAAIESRELSVKVMFALLAPLSN